NSENSRALAEKIRSAIENHTYEKNLKPLRVTASVGVADIKADDTFEGATKRADIALNKAKALGRNLRGNRRLTGLNCRCWQLSSSFFGYTVRAHSYRPVQYVASISSLSPMARHARRHNAGFLVGNGYRSLLDPDYRARISFFCRARICTKYPSVVARPAFMANG